LAQVPDLERGDLGAAQRRNPSCKPRERIARLRSPAMVIFGWRVAHLARLGFREGEGQAFVTI
jgi:hypothetical protein